MRSNQVTIIKWDVLTEDGFIREIKPIHHIVGISFKNDGNCTAYLWNDVKIEPGAMIGFSCDQTSYYTITRANLKFDLASSLDTVAAPKITVIAEKLEQINV